MNHEMKNRSNSESKESCSNSGGWILNVMNTEIYKPARSNEASSQCIVNVLIGLKYQELYSMSEEKIS
jgi:hypothetical protein